MPSAPNPHEQLLRAAVSELARPAGTTLASKPAGSPRPDELALAFDDAYTTYISNAADLPTEPQLLALQALDSALSAMSGPANAALWTESALETHPRWAEIRALASCVIEVFSWRAAQ